MSADQPPEAVDSIPPVRVRGIGRRLPPPFDSDRPWGAYRPRGIDKLAIGLTRRVSARARLFYRLVVMLRRPTKHLSRTALDVFLWGLRLRLLPRGNRSESAMLFSPQFLDTIEFAWLASKLGPGAVFLDVGANAGAYSFRVIGRFGDLVTVLAVEPDPEMRRRLTFNAATNGIENLRIFGVALSDHRGRATLSTNVTQRGQNQLDDGLEASSERGSVSVEVDTLAHLLESSGVDRIDALKIDIEGHEPRVLGHFFANAPRKLFPRAIVTEHKAETAEEIQEILLAHGYDRVGETPANWMFER